MHVHISASVKNSNVVLRWMSRCVGAKQRGVEGATHMATSSNITYISDCFERHADCVNGDQYVYVHVYVYAHVHDCTHWWFVHRPYSHGTRHVCCVGAIFYVLPDQLVVVVEEGNDATGRGGRRWKGVTCVDPCRQTGAEWRYCMHTCSCRCMSDCCERVRCDPLLTGVNECTDQPARCMGCTRKTASMPERCMFCAVECAVHSSCVRRHPSHLY